MVKTMFFPIFWSQSQFHKDLYVNPTIHNTHANNFKFSKHSSPSLILIIGHKNYMHPQNSSPSSLFCILGTYKRTWEKLVKYLHIHIVILKNDWDKEVGTWEWWYIWLDWKIQRNNQPNGFFFQFCDATKVAIIHQKI